MKKLEEVKETLIEKGIDVTNFDELTENFDVENQELIIIENKLEVWDTKDFGEFKGFMDPVSYGEIEKDLPDYTSEELSGFTDAEIEEISYINLKKQVRLLRCSTRVTVNGDAEVSIVGTGLSVQVMIEIPNYTILKDVLNAEEKLKELYNMFEIKQVHDTHRYWHVNYKDN